MRKSLFIGLVAILGLIGCSRNQEIDVPDANLSLFARTESPAESRTIVESGVHVYWEPGDEIAVFMGEKSAKFTTDITAASGTATFKGTFGDTTWPEEPDLWAVYPFSEDATFDGETITTVLPSEQVAREGSFGKDMNLAIAHSSGTTLQFYNVGGGIRFSVTEEGIKKVMFEGLSGEIISGKVKIGVDENGKPEVKEVTGGSQFITLLPPTGQDTFEKDTWYYIVAIPGTLEGGYKLRFYKETDYARKVSEKKVEIKRSIYGNIEKADEGIEYETTTTHFPETEEEWHETELSILDINVSIQALLEQLSDNDNIPNLLVNEATKIDGVISAKTSEDGELVYLQMQNGVYLNVPINRKDGELGGSSVFLPKVPKAISDDDSQKQTSLSTSPSGKKALVLVPIYDEVITECGLHAIGLYEQIKSSLYACGYEVHPYYNEEATLNRFRGKSLEQYDVVYINTHGSSFGLLANGEVTTTLQTGSTVSPDSPQQIDSPPTYLLCSNGVFYGITKDAIDYDHPHFNDSWFFLHACNGLTFPDLYQYLLDEGAALCSGFLTKAGMNSSLFFASDLVGAFASGMEYSAAYDWAAQNSTNENGESWREWSNYNDFDTKPRDDVESFYLYDSIPYDLSSVVNGNRVTLKWKVPRQIGTGEYRSFRLFIKSSVKWTEYDTEKREYQYNFSASEPGEYSWYITADLWYKGEYVYTYESDLQYFTVLDQTCVVPRAVDLGLSVKWGSFNLGASERETYDCYYYAWGETDRITSEINWDTYAFTQDGYYDGDHLTKYTIPDQNYNGSWYRGSTFIGDNKTTLDAEDDAARIRLGDKWRLPTWDEYLELRNNCTWEWVTRNGVNGYKVTSRIAGYNNYWIFLPADDVVGCSAPGSTGWYWTSTLSPYDSQCGRAFDFASDHIDYTYSARPFGYSIRPVYDDGTRKPRVSFTPSSCVFGEVLIGNIVSTGITFSNIGHATLKVTVDSYPDGFSTYPTIGDSFTVTANQPQTITINFNPNQAKTYSGTIVISTNDPDNPQLYISVSGTGVNSLSGKPLISVSPETYNFGNVTVDQYSRTAIEITNTGSADLNVYSIELVNGNQGFELGNTAGQGTISPGTSMSFGVRFYPKTKGYATDQIIIKSNASNSSSVLMTLTGTGI